MSHSPRSKTSLSRAATVAKNNVPSQTQNNSRAKKQATLPGRVATHKREAATPNGHEMKLLQRGDASLSSTSNRLPMKSPMVRPNFQFFAKLLEVYGSYRSAADACDIDTRTLGRILLGDKVREDVIVKAAAKLQTPIRELVDPEPGILMPEDLEFYEALKCGYYIDNDRNGTGELFWYKESIKLERPRFKKVGAREVLKFTGHIINEWGFKFKVVGERFNENHFSLTGISVKEGFSFDASFTKRIGNVLCGVWIGLDHFNRDIAVYRGFASHDPLKIEELRALTHRAPVLSRLEAQKIGYVPPPQKGRVEQNSFK